MNDNVLMCSTAEADHSGLHEGLRDPAAHAGDVLNGRSQSQRAALALSCSKTSSR